MRRGPISEARRGSARSSTTQQAFADSQASVSGPWLVCSAIVTALVLDLEERDLPVRLQHGEIDVRQPADALLSRRSHHIVHGQTLPAHDLTDGFAAAHHHD